MVRKFFTKETIPELIILCTMVIFIVALNALPEILKIIHTPTGHVYHPVHNNAIDYALYLSYEKQGLDGQNVLFDRFTTETHPGKWVNPFYLLLGRVWRITGITDPHIVYHTTRYFLAIVWAFLLYAYIRRSFTTKLGRFLALFLVLYSGSFPHYPFPTSVYQVTTYTNWWSELDPIVRATFLPAHMMGHILMLSTIMLLTAKKIPPLLLIFASATGFFAGLFHTPSLVLPVLLLPTWAMLTKKWQQLPTILLTLAISLLSFLILSQQFGALPWTNYWEYEKQSFAIPPFEYMLGIGPVAFLGIFGALTAWRKPQALVWILWIGIGFSAITLIPYLTRLPLPLFRSLLLSNIRFLQIALWVPCCLLTTTFLLWVRQKYGSIAFIPLISIIIIMTISIYPGSIYTNTINMYQGTSYQYPPKEWAEAIDSLEHKNKTKAVLSLPFAGLAIGGYVNRIAFVGRPYSTLDLYGKTDQAWTFYNGNISNCDAYIFLTSNNIGEIFFGYDEQKTSGNFTRYPFIRFNRAYGTTKIYDVIEKTPDECK